MTNIQKKNNSLIKKVATEVIVSLTVATVADITQIIKSLKASIIDIGEYDSAYNNINKMLYRINPKAYIKHRLPTANKDFYELSEKYFLFYSIKK